jgi:hypothetical protein
MSIKFIRKDISKTQVQYMVQGMGLGLQVTTMGIEVLGGAPAFDTDAEEREWKFQVDACVLLHQLMKQGAQSLPDDIALQNMAISMREMQ